MGKVIIPRVPSIGTVTGVADSAARQILQPLVDAHNTRNGDTEARFVTALELSERLAATSQQTTAGTLSTGPLEDERIERIAGELSALQSTVARSNSTSTNDGYSVGSGSGNVPINDGALNSNLNADLIDGLHAGHETGNVPVSDAVLCTDLNADMLDGMHAGHATGEIPVSDAALCTDLNADLLDGMHASELVHVGAVVTATKTATGKFMEVTLGGEVFYIPLYQ